MSHAARCCRARNVVESRAAMQRIIVISPMHTEASNFERLVADLAAPTSPTAAQGAWRANRCTLREPRSQCADGGLIPRAKRIAR
jgi:hypothetical protein